MNQRMNKQNIYFCLSLACAMLMAVGQIKAQGQANYVLTEKSIGSRASQKIQDYQFYDDLGRETLKATNGISNNGEFTYSLQEILGDQLITKKWLPVVSSSTVDCLDVNGISSLASDQYEDDGAFDNFEYDALGRPKEQYKAGDAWKAHPAIISNITNTSNDVKRYTVSISSSDALSLNDCGYYGSGTLSGTCYTNEDGMIVTVYTDAFGKKVLERRATNNDTYYVYDDFGRLTFVLMPEYQNNNDLDYYAFQYKYDLKGNLLMKKLPGCAPIEYLYDDCDRLVSIQDGELREKKLYRFMFYDNMGRLIIQGLSHSRPFCNNTWILTYSQNSGGLENTDYDIPRGNEYLTVTQPEPPTPLLAVIFNLTIEAIEVVNYFDDYSFLGGSNSDAFSGLILTNAPNAKGLLTGSLVLASDGETLAQLNVYDTKGNLIETQERGLNGNVIKTENTYTYTNKIATSNVTVNYPGRKSVVCHITNGYHPKNDRLAEVTYHAQVDTASTDGCKITYTYDPLGRISKINRPIKNVNGKLSFEYDIHGWIDCIASNSFQEQLHYNDGNGTPMYSGNISSMSWSNGSAPSRAYRYTYDSLNRLVNAEYGENHFSTGNGNFNESVSYDGNGNIKTLVRNGQIQGNTYGTIDNLGMEYDGNQLYSVNEMASPLLYSYSLDVKNSSMDIGYNLNGSLTKDGTRGITNITYDNNNNPVRIQFDNGNVTKYIYSATGEKLRAIHYTAMDNIHIDMGCDYEDIEDDYLAVDSTDYLCGGMILYTNAKPTKILFDGGYIDVSYVKRNAQRPRRTPGMTDEEYFAILERWRAYIAERTTLGYRFYNKGHLGNIREVIDEDGVVCQKTDYYPFGTPFSSETYAINAAYQPFKYNGKEFDMMHGLNTYDYGARQYHPLLPLWDRVDPLAEKYYSTSPYAYCLGNPVNYVDPDGKSTWVKREKDGNYSVFGGDIHDKDRNIYVYEQDDKGQYTIRGESVGVSATLTSFYNSDKNLWGGIINPHDESGIRFLSYITGEKGPSLFDYMYNARTGEKYDFKVTNGTDSKIDNVDIYRGMPISTSSKSVATYASARDVGNMAAGYIAAKNGISWKAARFAFDLYQGGKEGPSTVNAEMYGYSVLGYNTQAQRLLRQLKNKK